jgi:hypothetical protein
MRIGGRPTLSSRAIAGFIVALLIFAQGLAAHVSASSRVRHGETQAGAVASSLGASCRVDTIGGGESPAHERRDCLQCCVLCGVRDCAAPLFHDATRAADVQFPVSKASAPINRRFIDDDDGRPIGWASSWSSRAPPIFS